MVDHSEGCNESRTLCENLSEKLKSKIPSLKVSLSGGCCSFSVPNSRKFAYVYHRKVKTIIEVWCSGDMQDLLNQSYVEFRPGVSRTEPGWQTNFPGRFTLDDISKIENAVSLLYEISYKSVLSSIKAKTLLVKPDISREEVQIPEEIEEVDSYYEGTKTRITVNAYERDKKARRKCVKHFGVNCYVCGFNFEKQYGEIGKGYIHVHHLKPLSEISEKYKLNPTQDLIPVCPNCHSMLHKRKPPYSIDELKSKIRNLKH